MVKNPPALQETQIQSLDWKDPMEKGMATHSSILACGIPCMDRGAWWATVHGVTKSRNTGSILWWEDSQEKEIATHSSILAWAIPWTEEPGGRGAGATVHGVIKE